MPQLLGLVLIGAVAVAGYKSFQRAFGRATSDGKNHTAGGAGRERESADQAGPAAMKDLGALELDPHTGIYKPRG